MTEVPKLEGEPQFALFLDFLVENALLRPEQLVRAAEMIASEQETAYSVRLQ